MSSLNVRRGKYGLYNNKLYRILSKSISSKSDTIELCSTDEQDLKNGFTNNDSEFITKKYGFTCTKEVPKYEITEAYEITTYANYKGLKLYIHGKKSDNMLTLLHTQMISSHSERDREIRDTLIEMGFYVFNVDKFGLTYAKDVPIDDPELEIFEERKEIDISKL